MISRYDYLERLVTEFLSFSSHFLLSLRGRAGAGLGTNTGSHILEEYRGGRSRSCRGLGLEYLTLHSQSPGQSELT